MTLAIAAWQEAIARDTWLAHLRDQQALTRQLAAILRDAAQEAERLVARYSAIDGIAAELRAAQFAQSALALREIQAQLWGSVTKATQAGIDRTTLLAANGILKIDQVLKRAVGSTDLADSFLAAARHSVLNVRSRVLNDIRLSGLVYNNQALAAGKVDQLIFRGIATNKSAREIARDVAQFIDPNTPGGASFAAMRLGRTELNNAFHRTSVDAAASQPWVQGVKWNLSGSHPRPDVCNELADQNPDHLGNGVYDPADVPGKPHPQCLCFTTTVTEPVDKFLDKLFDGTYNNWLSTQGA